MTPTQLKGTSLIPFIFVIMLVVVGFLAWRSYGSGNTNSANEITDASVMNLIQNELESAKRFSKLSLSYASDQAIYEHALGGGICSPQKVNGWICNSPSPKDFIDSKKCLESYTLDYLNGFVKNYTLGIPLDYTLEPFKNVSYLIDFNGVIAGKYDEGNYYLDVEGSSIKISAKSSRASQDIKLEEDINKNRYWYLYRNFYNWSKTNVFSKEVRDCTITCQGCECIEHAAEKALDDLKLMFDKFVTCKAERICCTRGPSRMTGLLKGFSFWDQQECISNCQEKCSDAKNGNYAINRYPFNVYKFTSNSDGISDNKIAAVYEFICTNDKYFVATGEGPVPLTFKVRASSSFVDNGAC